MPSSFKHGAELVELRLNVAGFQTLGMVDELRQPGDLFAQHGRVGGKHLLFELADDPLLLFFGQVVEVVGHAALDLLLAIGLGVFEDLLAAVAHAFQAAADRVDRRGHAALEHGHREADRTAPRRWVAGGRHRLVFHVAGQLVVEIELLAVEIEGGRADLAIGEQLADLAGLGMRESVTNASLVRRR